MVGLIIDLKIYIMGEEYKSERILDGILSRENPHLQQTHTHTQNTCDFAGHHRIDFSLASTFFRLLPFERPRKAETNMCILVRERFRCGHCQRTWKDCWKRRLYLTRLPGTHCKVKERNIYNGDTECSECVWALIAFGMTVSKYSRFLEPDPSHRMGLDLSKFE